MRATNRLIVLLTASAATSHNNVQVAWSRGKATSNSSVAWFEFQVSVPAAVQWAESRQLNQAHLPRNGKSKIKCFVCSSGSGRNLNRFCNFSAFHSFNNAPLSGGPKQRERYRLGSRRVSSYF